MHKTIGIIIMPRGTIEIGQRLISGRVSLEWKARVRRPGSGAGRRVGSQTDRDRVKSSSERGVWVVRAS